MYKRLLKPFLFRLDPERVHDAFTAVGETLGRFALARQLLSLPYGHRGRDISKVVDGIAYRTPVLLAAGFDYNARLTQILPCLGFGGVEVGSVTARPCAGNPGPQLTRLPKSESILVNKGLKNDGADRIIKRLRSKQRIKNFVIGASIARTNDEESASDEAGLNDYIASFQKLTAAGVGDYYTLNISCPNAFGGETFTEPEPLAKLLRAIKAISCAKPIYAKMPINLPWDEFDKLLKIIAGAGLQGVIIGNLNKNYRDLAVRSEAPQNYSGGVSGKPCFALSNELIKKTKAAYGDNLTIIGCGGIFSPEDAMEKFRAGCDLVQLITGLIFTGPALIKSICRAYASAF